MIDVHNDKQEYFPHITSHFRENTDRQNQVSDNYLASR